MKPEQITENEQPAGVLGSRLTVSVSEAAELVGISRAKAYDCVRTGELPSLRFGRRIVVPTRALIALLGAPARLDAQVESPPGRC